MRCTRVQTVLPDEVGRCHGRIIGRCLTTDLPVLRLGEEIEVVLGPVQDVGSGGGNGPATPPSSEAWSVIGIARLDRELRTVWRPVKFVELDAAPTIGSTSSPSFGIPVRRTLSLPTLARLRARTVSMPSTSRARSAVRTLAARKVSAPSSSRNVRVPVARRGDLLIEPLKVVVEQVEHVDERQG